jgi:hypothetical protein
MGRGPARSAAEDALAAQTPARVFTCGFAGGLNPALRPGSLLFETEDPSVASVLTALGASRAAFHCLPRVATTRTEKASLRQSTGADAVEMESGVIREICRQRNIPVTTVRVISDSADEDLPLDFNTLMTPEGTLRIGRLIGQTVLRPDRWRGLWRLQIKTRDAARRLGGCVEELLRRLD